MVNEFLDKFYYGANPQQFWEGCLENKNPYEKSSKNWKDFNRGKLISRLVDYVFKKRKFK